MRVADRLAFRRTTEDAPKQGLRREDTKTNLQRTLLLYFCFKNDTKTFVLVSSRQNDQIWFFTKHSLQTHVLRVATSVW